LEEALRGLNKVLLDKCRLGIMTILYLNKRVDFKYLLSALRTSEGNLASHLNRLEREGYIIVIKRFKGRRPQTLYELTEEGRRAFEKHIEMLEEIVREVGKRRVEKRVGS